MHATSRLNRWLCFVVILLAGILKGCNGNSDFYYSAPDIVLVDLLPATTRGYLQLSRAPGPLPRGWEELASHEGAPWRHTPVDILRYYTGGMNLIATAEQLILAQPANSGDEYALLVEIDKDEGEALLDVADLVSAGQYQGFSLQAMAGTGLLLARLDDRTWVIAPRKSLEQVIDVHVGTLPNIRASAIANYLDSLDEAQPITFVYGLPALYKQVVPPGNGAHSLTEATVVRGAFNVQSDTLDGQLQFISANAKGYTQRLLEVLPETNTASFEAVGNGVNIDLAGLSVSADSRQLLKSLFIGMDTIDYSETVVHGGNVPWMNFKVGQDPNSIFINFEFKSQTQREAFAAEHLPPGFTLAPIRILDTDTPRYFLVLNVYQSSGGLVQGARAEWSVFVHDPAGGEPRFLVVQAAAESLSADPVNLVTLPEPVSHLLEPDAISSYVGVADETTGDETLYFSSDISWPQLPENLVAFHREFAAANDYIFWGNGVADRGLHNATVHNRNAVLIESDQISLVDSSRWSQYINAEPVHSVVFRNPLDIVISPWWNLDADYLDVTEDYRQTLIDFKNGFYPMTVKDLAEKAMRGEGSALGAFTLGETVPTTRYYFVISDPAALFASVGVDSRFTPLAIALHDGETPDYYLSLVVAGRSNDPCSLRAEWVTYVLGENGRPQTLQLDTLSGDACLDPVSLLGLPAVVEHGADGAKINTRLASTFIRMEAQLDVTRGADVKLGLDWIEAGDQVCALNGVCDYFYYDGQILVQPASRIEAGDVVINELVTPWDDFIQPLPVEVTVQQTPSTYATNAWKNVGAFGL